jgi:hypothetical protein
MYKQPDMWRKYMYKQQDVWTAGTKNEILYLYKQQDMWKTGFYSKLDIYVSTAGYVDSRIPSRIICINSRICGQPDSKQEKCTQDRAKGT